MSQDKGFFSSIIRGVLIAVIIVLIEVLIFGFVLKLTWLNGGIIKAVNQFLKILAIFIGCMISIKGNLGALKGAIIGLIFTIIIHFLFALFGKGLSFGAPFLIEMIYTFIIGGICGLISVNSSKQ